MMTREQIEIEVNKILVEATELEKRAVTENETAVFLNDETNKLLMKSNDESLSFDERELICKQLLSLQRRLQIESNLLIKDMKQLSELNKRLDYYSTLITEEQ